jgi:hypothetical protein
MVILCDHVEDVIRHSIPPKELESIVDNIGLPVSGINVSYNNGGTIGSFDADILISLNREKHHRWSNRVKLLPSKPTSDWSRKTGGSGSNAVPLPDNHFGATSASQNQRHATLPCLAVGWLIGLLELPIVQPS